MNILSEYLDSREEVERSRWASGWTETSLPAAERLLRFDTWVTGRLEAHLDWTWAGEAKAKRIEQCRVYLERIVLDLWRRGWLLDGRALARHLQLVLVAIGQQQKAGKVQSFWPYFQAAVNRYVGVNSEEIRDEAMKAGSHISQALALLGRTKAPTLPELAAQRVGEIQHAKEQKSVRSEMSKARRLQAQKKAIADQPQLF